MNTRTRLIAAFVVPFLILTVLFVTLSSKPSNVPLALAEAKDTQPGTAPISKSAAEENRPLALVGSDVATDACYQPAKSQVVCFTIHNASPDYEWLTRVRLTFPTLNGAWNVSCLPGGQDSTDSVGNVVNFNCTTPQSNVIIYEDIDNESPNVGEIYPGASWQTCMELTIPAAYNGNRIVNWGLTGNNGTVLEGALGMAQCTPLYLFPGEFDISGCNGVMQSIDFALSNYEAGNVIVDLEYQFEHGEFTGPASLALNTGEQVTFTATIEPNLCLDAGGVETAVLTAQARGTGIMDQSEIQYTITSNNGWSRENNTPFFTMDNVVVWANHADGGLWSIGGFGEPQNANRYDPASDSWLSFTAPISPSIEYPIDGCYGLNGDNDEVIILFPDTIVTDTLHIFNITTRSWYQESVPAAYPAEGRWAQDVVSMLNHTGENVCYLSGGATQPGGGQTRDLWRYYPGNNQAAYVGPFAEPGLVFNFHASWYVPWIGSEGAICVAGGADHNTQINNSTQCYDIGANQFNPQNSDLGTLPEPWWGMADGWAVYNGEYQLWLANGAAADGSLLPASAYIAEGMSNFVYGPPVPEPLYRLEGTGWHGEFVTLNGARGGFTSSPTMLLLGACPECKRIFLPEMIHP